MLLYTLLIYLLILFITLKPKLFHYSIMMYTFYIMVILLSLMIVFIIYKVMEKENLSTTQTL